MQTLNGKQPPRHQGEGGFAYYRRTGWMLPIAGGQDNPPGGEGEKPPGEGDKPTGDAGKKDDDDPETWDAKRAKATIEAQRVAEREAKAEAAQAKKDLAAAKKRLDEIDAANLSDKEKADKAAADATAEAAAVNTRLKETTLKYEVQLAAAKAEANDPADILAMLDRSKIEYDKDSGEPTNIGKLVDELLKAKPYLKKNGSTANGNGHVPGTPKPADGGNLSAEQDKEARASQASFTRNRL